MMSSEIDWTPAYAGVTCECDSHSHTLLAGIQ